VATKWCSQCGSSFLATVERCPDCDLVLIERDEPERDPAVDADPAGQVAYELHEWAVESRTMLDQLLTAEGIPRAWEGTDLVVPAFLEERVDELIDQVDVTTIPVLDPEADRLVYELYDWDDELIGRLTDALAESEIPHEYDEEGNLVVLAVDEARVETVLEATEFPDALDVDDGDGDGAGDGPSGLAAQDTLSDLFVAADRLHHHARDHEGVLGLVAAATAVEALPVPFGFAPAVWDDIVTRATALRDALEQDSLDDEGIEEDAARLRTVLRDLV
jgi:hypothetical protein